MKARFLIAGVLMSGLSGAADRQVSFVSCPKCDRRFRIAADGRSATVNVCRLDGLSREAAADRARRYLALGAFRPTGDAKSPLMGWSSWNTFALNISEEIILSVARAMATNGLKAAGYRYVNIDDGFFDGHDAEGRLKWHPKRFPNGMKGTVDGIHALGLKAGTYSDAGDNTCGSLDGKPGGDPSGIGAGLYGHDAADCRLHFGELGFDFFKVDYCGGYNRGLDERTRYFEIAAAIRATGRTDVRLNICRWAFPGTWAAEIAGSWRTTSDIRASWKSLKAIISENLYLSAFASPGHFNDMDMLEVDRVAGTFVSTFGDDVGMTRDEELTHFGLWCLMSSPLVLGCDPRRMSAETMRLVTNPYLLAMNQDGLGLQAYVAAREGEAYVLVKDAERRFGPSRYVALYNAGDAEHRFVLRSRDVDLGGRVDAFDLADRSDCGSFSNEVSVAVAPHATRFFRLDAERRLERTVYEAETAYLPDYQELKDADKAWTAHAVPVTNASGGVAVTKLGKRPTNDLVFRDVRITSPGRRRLVFFCRAEGARSLGVSVDGGSVRTLDVSGTAGAFAPVAYDVDLAGGLHEIRLTNPSAPLPDVDRMEIAARCAW